MSPMTATEKKSGISRFTHPRPVPRAFCALALLPCLAAAQPAPDIFEIPLADLLDIEIQVSSISRRAQSLAESAAAVYVLTADDIRNSPARNLPDLLRTVPGIEVAQLDANKWAVSARGFNSRLASKLLLIVDGRTVYSSSFAAVFWETEDLPLENIERIEVIRGPGATIWGANAVNGVVSITTREADAGDRGFSVLAGNRYRQQSFFQTGAALGENTALRVYGSLADIAALPAPDGGSAMDGWESRRFGFRVDGGAGADTLSVEANWFDQDIDQRVDLLVHPNQVLQDFESPVQQAGANAVARWRRERSDGGSVTAQFFYDYKERSELLLAEEMETYDVDLYYNALAGSHSLTMGGGLRLIHHRATPTPFVSYEPNSESMEIYSLALYDDIHVTDRTIFGLGLKVEDNIYTGTEYQSNLRLSHALSGSQHLWGAMSRAVRTPSRAERSSRILLGFIPQGSLPEVPQDLYITTVPNDSFDVEELESFEFGWRLRRDNLGLDFAAFYNRYDGLRNATTGIPYCHPDPLCTPESQYILQPLILINSDRADSYGFEGVIEWKPSENFSFEASYSYFDIDYESGEGLVQAESGLTPNRDNPLGKLVLQANWRVSDSLMLNLVQRSVSKPGLSGIPAYRAADVKLDWAVNDFANLSFTVRNLGESRHMEFVDPLVGSTRAMVETGYHLGVDLRW